MTQKMPAIFLGHGNPMNALSQNGYTSGWASFGKSIPRPNAILAISAHWYITDSAVTTSCNPQTIYDFGGFPDALYQVTYPAPGSPELARRVNSLLAPVPVRFDDHRGLDHGTWAVLIHAFPDADIPVVQLSIDATKPPAFHYDMGKKLRSLREEGVLIVGSGNVVHNLSAYQWGDTDAAPYDWAVRFETRIREQMMAGHHESLVDYQNSGRDAMLSIPTPDHFLPLLYILGGCRKTDEVRFPIQGIDGGSISMLAVQVG